jgi:hypothetical protein
MIIMFESCPNYWHTPIVPLNTDATIGSRVEM